MKGNGLLKHCLAAAAEWMPDGRFRGLKSFCVFIGYPRSGHSLVAALIDGHPDAVISQEVRLFEDLRRGADRRELFEKILQRSRNVHQSRSNIGGYCYQDDELAQGRYRKLRVLGDKRGGSTTRYLADDPTLLGRLEEVVRVPVSIVHVVRSPFDNISTLYRKHREHEDAFWATPTLDDAIRLYFNLCRRVLTIKATCGRFVHQVYGDDLITNRYGEIHRLLGFLDLEATPGYVDAAAKRIFTEPSRTRRQIDWQPRQIDEVYRCIEEVDFLDRYRSEPFHLPEAA